MPRYGIRIADASTASLNVVEADSHEEALKKYVESKLTVAAFSSSGNNTLHSLKHQVEGKFAVFELDEGIVMESKWDYRQGVDAVRIPA